jgi:hypothetical protein
MDIFCDPIPTGYVVGSDGRKWKTYDPPKFLSLSLEVKDEILRIAF